MAKSNSIGFEHLYTQLRVTNKLLAAQLRDKLKQVDLIGLLSTTGASDGEIADILGTTPATVSVTKAKLRKRVRDQMAKAAPEAAAPVAGEL
jgi:DNA-directed RNA polymerase specialized sigma24 family protein